MTSSDRPSARLRLVAEIEDFLGPPLAKCPAPPPSLKTQRDAATARLHEMVRESLRAVIASGQYNQADLAREMGCSGVFLLEVLRQSRPVQSWLIILMPHAAKVEFAKRLSQNVTSESDTGT